MIDHLLLFCTTIFVYEFIKFFNLIKNIKQNFIFSKKIINLFKLKKTSDFRKEKLTFYYSKYLLFSSIKILFICLSILMFIILINKFSLKFFDLLLSISGLIELSIIFIIYHQFKKKINAKL